MKDMDREPFADDHAHEHSVYTRCLECLSWGINTPNEGRCGNCRSHETILYVTKCCVDAAVKKSVEKFREKAVDLIRSHPCSVSIYGSSDSAKGAYSALNYIASLIESMSTEPEGK